MSNNFKGALWIIASCIAATVMSLGIKGLAGHIHSSQIVLIRCLLGLIFIMPMLNHVGFEQLKSVQLRLHLIRGVCAAVAINLGFYSLTQLPLTTVTVLFFSAPLFVVIIAQCFTKESVGWRRLVATLVGFVGTIVVVNPRVDSFELIYLYPITSSFFFAISLILNKRLSTTDHPSVLMFYVFLVVSICSVPVALVHWQAPNFNQWLLLVLVVSLFATLRTYFDIRGYALAEASFVAPFQYFRIIFVGIAAYFIFLEVIKTNVFIGASIIIMSTLYIAQREYRLNKRTKRINENFG